VDYRNQIQDVEELCQCVEEEWGSLDQRVIDIRPTNYKTNSHKCATNYLNNNILIKNNKEKQQGSSHTLLPAH